MLASRAVLSRFSVLFVIGLPLLRILRILTCSLLIHHALQPDSNEHIYQRLLSLSIPDGSSVNVALDNSASISLFQNTPIKFCPVGKWKLRQPSIGTFSGRRKPPELFNRLRNRILTLLAHRSFKHDRFVSSRMPRWMPARGFLFHGRTPRVFEELTAGHIWRT